MKTTSRKTIRGHKILAALICLTMIMQLTSCEKQAPVAVNQADKMKGELSVYYVDYAEQTAGQSEDNPDFVFETTRALQKLQDKYPAMELKATPFGSHEAFMSQVSTELNSGKGPDLFILDHGTMLNWNKMASNGIFENLTPYLKDDISYHSEDYLQPVIKAGQIGGKQYVLPLSFQVITLFASKNTISENGENFEDGYDYKEILSAITTSIDKANKDDEVVPLSLALDRKDYLSCFMQAFGMPFVDYEKKSANLDKESLLNLCNFIKNFYPYIDEAIANKVENASMTQNVENVEYTLDNYNYVEEIIQHNVIRTYIDDENVLLTMPKYDDSNATSAFVNRYAAVNGNSKNKQLAYDTARVLMDIADDNKTVTRFPVNKKSLNTWIKQYTDMQWYAWVDKNTVPFEGDLEIDKIAERMTNISYVTIENYTVMQIANDGMMPYIEGTGTFDDCYDETVNKLNLYINE